MVGDLDGLLYYSVLKDKLCCYFKRIFFFYTINSSY